MKKTENENGFISHLTELRKRLIKWVESKKKKDKQLQF